MMTINPCLSSVTDCIIDLQLSIVELPMNQKTGEILPIQCIVECIYQPFRCFFLGLKITLITTKFSLS